MSGTARALPRCVFAVLCATCCLLSGGARSPPPFDFEKVQELVHKAGLASSFKNYAESALLYAKASQLMGTAVNVVLQQRMGDAKMHIGDYEGKYYQKCLLQHACIIKHDAG